MLQRDRIVADAIIGKGTVIIPLPSALLHLLEHMQPLAEIAALDIVQRRAHVLRVLAFFLLLIAAAAERITLSAEAPELAAERIPSVAAVTAAPCAAVSLLCLSLALPLIHDHAVGLLDLLELFLQFLLVRLTDIGIRVIFAAERTICFFDFFFCCVIADAEYLIWIHLQSWFLLSALAAACASPSVRHGLSWSCRNAPRHRNTKCF